jgi:hypothetical protein
MARTLAKKEGHDAILDNVKGNHELNIEQCFFISIFSRHSLLILAEPLQNILIFLDAILFSQEATPSCPSRPDNSMDNHHHTYTIPTTSSS